MKCGDRSATLVLQGSLSRRNDGASPCFQDVCRMLSVHTSEHGTRNFMAGAAGLQQGCHACFESGAVDGNCDAFDAFGRDLSVPTTRLLRLMRLMRLAGVCMALRRTALHYIDVVRSLARPTPASQSHATLRLVLECR